MLEEMNQADADHPSDQDMAQRAINRGYTRSIMGDCDECTLCLLVKPEADLDGRFRAWDLDENEWIFVNGWLFTFEDAA